MGGDGGAVETDVGEVIGGRGGDGYARATAEGTGDGPVSASASAYGGAGGRFSRCCGGGGAGTVSAFARSLGGGAVQVSADLHGGVGSGAAGGADVSLVDVVAGETIGALSLSQFAEGGDGFQDGAGGDAESHLSVSDTDGGALSLTSAAWGGAGAGSGSGSPGGAALASAVAHGTGQVEVDASANGGEGGGGGVGRGGDGGTAALGPVFGSSSGGGLVMAIGSLRAGIGGGGAEPGVDPDAILVNHVDGATAGPLLLSQSASAFGRAESRLERTHEGAALVLVTQAEGDDATAVSDASNPLGLAWAHTSANGLPGSDVRTEARAWSEADRAPVLVNGELVFAGFRPSAVYGARGSSSNVSAGSRTDLNRAPGNASSLAVGVHAGDGEVIVFDRAVGGSTWDPGFDGGSARSEAHASNAGRSLVAAISEARGGESRLSNVPRGGDAESLAEALGGREAIAVAQAFAGDAPLLERTGGALARATAGGTKAQAGAEASGAGVTARVLAASRQAATVEARLAAADVATATAPADGFARATLAPGAEVVEIALADSPAVAAALAGAEVAAFAELGGGRAGAGRLTLGAEIEMGAAFFAASAFDGLLVGFLDPELAGKASLRVSIELDGARVFRAKVRGAAAIADLALSLGASPNESLRITLELKTKDAADAASLGLVVAGTGGALLAGQPAAMLASVPEPRAWLLLLAFGLALLRAARPRQFGQ
jgi:hypothetical protein